MTVQQALQDGVRALREVSDEENLEAEMLLCYALNIDRVRLYQRLQDVLTPEQEALWHSLLQRRLQREPLAYITGRKEFFGLEMEMTPAALIPRPETELLIELALDYLHGRPTRSLVADIGAGCGAIALALAANTPAETRILAVDISAAALNLARRNAIRLGLAERVNFLQADLLSGQHKPFDLIVGNLPYVRTRDWESATPEMHHEPRRALDGGPDGLQLIARMLAQAPPLLKLGGAVFCEIGEGQGQAARELAEASFPGAEVHIHPDLAGLDRVLEVRL